MNSFFKKNAKVKLAGMAVLCMLFGGMVGFYINKIEVETIKEVEGISLFADAKESSIEVSEADNNNTRIDAYANNLSVTYNGESLDISDGTVLGNSYYFNGGNITFSVDENGVVSAVVTYGAKTASTTFNANENALNIGDNAIYGSTSYGYMFDGEGNVINDGHITSHEQDVDSDGNVIGIQDESKMVMSESFTPSSKPETSTTAPAVEGKVDYNTTVNQPANNTAGGADMGNVEQTTPVVETAPTAQFRQIVIANSNCNGDGSTLNYVSTNGGSGTLAVVCTSVNGNTYTCVDAQGAMYTLTMSTTAGGVTFSGITGVYA